MQQEIPVRIGARAVDVGYFNVKFTLGQTATSEGSPVATGIFPALAPTLKTGSARMLADAPASDGCLVEIGKVAYFVGAGAAHHSKGIEPCPITVEYALSDKYLALLRGALFYMACDAGSAREVVIDYLVLGLPLTTYHLHHRQLGQRALGMHVMRRSTEADAHRVIVRQARVIVQPAGALISLGARSGRMPDGLSLVIDVGGGTLDWYLTTGSHPNLERSGAYPKAMLECAFAVADRVNTRWRDQFAIVQRIDSALRQRAASFHVQGKQYCLADFEDVVDTVLEEALNQMLSTVGATDDIDHVLLTGGGAPLFADHLRRRLPQFVPILRLDPDPVYSNVRGFQVAGEHYLQATAAAR